MALVRLPFVGMHSLKTLAFQEEVTHLVNFILTTLLDFVNITITIMLTCLNTKMILLCKIIYTHEMI